MLFVLEQLLWVAAVNQFAPTETVVVLLALAAHTAINAIQSLEAPLHLLLW
jgi:hypothetical protein